MYFLQMQICASVTIPESGEKIQNSPYILFGGKIAPISNFFTSSHILGGEVAQCMLRITEIRQGFN